MLKGASQISCRLSPVGLQFRSKYTTAHAKNDGKSTLQHLDLPSPNDIDTVGKLLDQAADFYSHKDLFRHSEERDRFTYVEVKEHTNAVANGLLSARIFPGKTLAVSLQNDTENLIVRLAANKIGVQIAHLNVNSLTKENILDRFDKLQPRALITNPSVHLQDILPIYDAALPEVSENVYVGYPLKSKRYPDFKLAITTTKDKYIPGWTSFKDVLLYNPLPDPLPKVAAEQSPSANTEIHFTRFQAKEQALSFSHSGLVKSALQFGAVSSLKDKRVCFAGGLWEPEVQTSLLASIAYGSMIVIPSYWFRAAQYVQQLEKETCDVLVSNPSNLRNLLSAPQLDGAHLRLESLIVLNTPADFADSELLSAAKKRLRVKQIEVSFTSDGASGPFLQSVFSDVSKATGSLLGAPVPNTEAKVVDASGNIAAVGTTGRLFTKGSHVLSGGFGSAQSELKKDGWLDAGINATMDSQGNFFLARAN